MKDVQKEKTKIWNFTNFLFIVILIAGINHYFLFPSIIVDGESMLPTIEHENRMIVNKLSYIIEEPERYDIVVFHANEDKDYIKRIIGLPGDHIAYKNDQLYINGEIRSEPYLSTTKNLQNNDNISFTGDFTLEEVLKIENIPEGYVFVLGDNRQSSKDSRFFGLVPINEIVGSTNFVYWPINEMKFVK